jgi:FkbM family methyltransferase
MNSLSAKLIRGLIPPSKPNSPVTGFLQKVRRSTFRVFCNAKNGYFSQAGQDKFLNEVVFHGTRNGTFVEIGAADGVLYSNTYYFEKELGWTGICVEPRPSAFRKLSKARKCLCVQACVTDSSGPGRFLDIEDIPLLSGLVSKYDPRHLERARSEAAEGGSKIRCYTLSELVQQSGFRAIDYLSIDTEGSKLDLLKTIDFAQFSVKVVSVENSFANGQFEQIMNGYDLIGVIGDDDIYLLRNCDPGRHSSLGASN